MQREDADSDYFIRLEIFSYSMMPVRTVLLNFHLPEKLCYQVSGIKR